MRNNYACISRNILRIIFIAAFFSTLFITKLSFGNEKTQINANFNNNAYDSFIFNVQKRLKDRGYFPEKLDGIFGEQTKAALKIFQQKNRLLITGELDEETKDKLGLSTKNSKNSVHTSKKRYFYPIALIILTITCILLFISYISLKKELNNIKVHIIDPNQIIDILNQQLDNKTIKATTDFKTIPTCTAASSPITMR